MHPKVDSRINRRASAILVQRANLLQDDQVVYMQEWLAILCTDCSLTEKEIIKIYGIRWDIGVSS
nr:hypothetical protein [Aneurinibacillus terranovensis]